MNGIAVSMPGIIDSANGHVIMGGALEYNDFYFKNALYKRCPVKIAVNNDAKCAASAEAKLGALKDVGDGVVLLFGTMIGGGIVIDHKVRKGIHCSAGEVSYILTDRAADPLYETVWGNRNGIPMLCRYFARKKGLPEEEVDGIRVFEAVNSGDKEAIEVLNDFAKEIAVQIFNLQTVLDMERFAIGGESALSRCLLTASDTIWKRCMRHLRIMFHEPRLLHVNTGMMRTLSVRYRSIWHLK